MSVNKEISPGLAEFRLEIQRYKKSWAEVKSHLPRDFNPHHRKFLRQYFRAQVRIAGGQRTKAGEIFDGLIKCTGYKEFEQEQEPYLAAIDLLVKGKTNLQGVEPAFRVKTKSHFTSLPKK